MKTARLPIEWTVSPGMVEYPDAVAAMERRVESIIAGREGEQVWLLEHPPLYTAGTSAQSGDLLENARFPVYPSGRGGRYTYHGPGQRVAYLMLDLRRRGQDLRAYVRSLEQWIIATLALFGVRAFIREGRIGVWVETQAGEAKIAAIGIRVRKWVSFHGISLNVRPDLSHYAGIVPCGTTEFGVTSLQKLGIDVAIQEVDAVLQETFEAACL